MTAYRYKNTYRKSNKNLPPEPPASSPFTKFLNQIAGQRLVIPGAHMLQEPNSSARWIGFPVGHESLPSNSGMPVHKLMSAVRVVFNARMPAGGIRK